MLKRSSLFCILALFLFTNYVNAQVIKAVADDDWSLPTTWDLGRIPLSTDMVIIEGFDVLLDISAEVVSLQIKNSASGDNTRLQVAGGGIVLSIVGDLNINSIDENYDVDFQVEDTDSVYIGGNLNISRNNTNTKRTRLNLTNDSKLIIAGDLNYNYYNSEASESEDEILLDYNALLEVGGDVTFTISGGNDFVFLSSGSSIVDFQNDVNINVISATDFLYNVIGDALNQVEGNFNLSNNNSTAGITNAILQIGTSSGTMQISGNLNLTSGFAGQNAKLLIHGGSSSLQIGGDINYEAAGAGDVGIIQQHESVIYLRGGINRSSTNNYGFYDMEDDTKLYYNGSGAQTIPGNDAVNNGSDYFSFSNLYFNNSKSFSLESNISITNELVLMDGIITTSASATFILEDQAIITGGSKTAYIDGPLIKIGQTNNQNFVFPIGDNGIYAPIEIDKITNPTVEYTAQYMGCPPPTISSVNNPLKKLNPQGYWTLDRNDANAVGNVTLHWDDANNTGLTDLNSLVVSYYNTITSSWFSLGQGVTTGSIGPAASGSISNDSGCPPPTIAGIFTMGSTDENENALLPVELANFSAYEDSDNSMISLEWETVSETNSDYFIIEKSYDGITFQEIGHVEAAKNSSSAQFYHARDYEPVKGNNYYRIQMVDQDRTMSFSDLANVFINDQEEDMIIFPNPVKDFIKLYNKNLTGQIVNINIHDMAGKCVYSNRLESEPGILQLYTSDMSLTKSGIYFLNVEDKGKVFSLKFFKIPN